MKELLYFYLPSCPYCIRANRYLRELFHERPELRAVRVRRINERACAALAGTYDYHLVPSFFIGHRKLHEGIATREDVARALEQAYSSNT